MRLLNPTPIPPSTLQTGYAADPEMKDKIAKMIDNHLVSLFGSHRFDWDLAKIGQPPIQI